MRYIGKWIEPSRGTGRLPEGGLLERCRDAGDDLGGRHRASAEFDGLACDGDPLGPHFMRVAC